MLRRSILVSLFVLGIITPSYAQDPIADSVTSALNAYFGGGELPVRDGGVRGATAAIKADTAIEVIKQTAMLIDMLKQAVLGSGPGNGETGMQIQAQAEDGELGSILYGHDTDAAWQDVYQENMIYERGEWNEEEALRDHRRLTTQRDLTRKLGMRFAAFQQDELRIHDLEAAVDGAGGRNELMGAMGKAMTEVVHQLHGTQELLLMSINAQSVAHGGEVNDVMQKRAQQSYVATDGGKPAVLVQWADTRFW